ncbi:MAG: UDP-N-acetylglucosamine pyrophosphorylase [Saccharofermentanales bacterium]|jgi:NDP-sugar pyrophosphorylase family protein
MEKFLTTKALFPHGYGAAEELLNNSEYPWEILKDIGSFIEALGNKLPESDYIRHPGNVWIARTATIAQSAFLGTNIIVGPGTAIRHCAFLRGNALIGNNCVVGNSAEIKNSILIEEVEAPHFNYIGDSILGYGTHLGAGVITSNIKSDRTNVEIRVSDDRIKTELRKMGAIIGDLVEIGCNAVLNPGTVIGVGSRIYPLTMVRGYVPSHSILKQDGTLSAIDT